MLLKFSMYILFTRGQSGTLIDNSILILFINNIVFLFPPQHIPYLSIHLSNTPNTVCAPLQWFFGYHICILEFSPFHCCLYFSSTFLVPP